MNIILYTKTGCPWCQGVMEFLNEKGIAYEERDTRKKPDYFREMLEKSGQEKAPTLDIDGYILSDSDKDQVEAYLKSKGAL
jgi:glutaredoxin 3